LFARIRFIGAAISHLSLSLSPTSGPALGRYRRYQTPGPRPHRCDTPISGLCFLFWWACFPAFS
jgi:hypothetical protein